MALVDLVDLAQLLGHTGADDPSFRTGKAEQAVRLVEIWLRSAAGDDPVDEDPPPADLSGWALELAASVYSNPEGLSRLISGEVTREWPGTRRAEVLAAAAAAYPRAGGATGGSAPRGSFPPPQPWPC